MGEPFPNPADASYCHATDNGNVNKEESRNIRDGILPNIGTSVDKWFNGTRNLSVDAQPHNKRANIPTNRSRDDLMNRKIFFCVITKNPIRRKIDRTILFENH